MPSKEALNAFHAYANYLVEAGLLDPDYSIYGIRQVRKLFPDAPNDEFFKVIQTWDHWKRNDKGPT